MTPDLYHRWRTGLNGSTALRCPPPPLKPPTWTSTRQPGDPDYRLSEMVLGTAIHRMMLESPTIATPEPGPPPYDAIIGGRVIDLKTVGR